MDTRSRWQLAYMYNRPRGTKIDWNTATLQTLYVEAPLIHTWPRIQQAGQLLLEQLQCIVDEVNGTHANRLLQRKDTKTARQLCGSCSPLFDQNQELAPRIVDAKTYATEVRKMDNTLAMQVARREATKMRKCAVQADIAPSVELPVSQLREYVKQVLRTPVTPSTRPTWKQTLGLPPTTPMSPPCWLPISAVVLLPTQSDSVLDGVPDSVPESIRRAAKLLEQARIQVLGVEMILRQPSVNIVDSQELVPKTQLPEDLSQQETPSQKQQRILPPNSPPRHVPLAN